MFNLRSVVALLAACAIGVGADNCEFPQRIGITPARAAKAKAAFRSAGLVPGKVGRAGTFNPTIEVIPNYNGKVVNFGTNFTTPETLEVPQIRFDAEPGIDPVTTNYTVFLLDPDVPMQDPSLPGFFLHLGRYDMHPTCVKKQTQQKVIRPYESLTPGSVESHRYVFLVYRQPKGVFTPPFQVPNVGGASFNLQKFVREGKLVGPLGGNYLLEGQGNSIPGGG